LVTETLELLEELLAAYAGTLLLVSHDRAFLNNVVTSTLVFEGVGEINAYPGGYDDWLEQRKKSVKSKQTSSAPIAQKPKATRKLSNKERAELKELPLRIEQLEEELNNLNQSMANPVFYQGTKEEILAVTTRAEEIPAELEYAYERWEELEDEG